MGRILKNQGYHLAVYLAVGAALYAATARLPADGGTFWGLTPGELVLVSWILAGGHQGWVAFFWRLELYGGTITAWMGPAGFAVYRVGFVVLALARLLLLIPIAGTTRGTFPMPPALSWGLIVLSTPFILWGLYSVVFYFGLNRAFGADHFDPAYRAKPLELRGTFKYVPNSMYTIILLVLYHPGLAWHSGLGLVAALAHHALIWTHYFCTEKPDMAEIYGAQRA